MRRIEQALRFKAGFKHKKAAIKFALAFAPHGFNIELELPIPRIYRCIAGYYNLHAVADAFGHIHCILPKHYPAPLHPSAKNIYARKYGA